jgi:catechol-2,3-dioxygenase
MHPETRIGHVHLKVADLQRALDFYCGVLGFELYWDRPQAEWPRTPAGELAMHTAPLNLQALLDASDG